MCSWRSVADEPRDHSQVSTGTSPNHAARKAEQNLLYFWAILAQPLFSPARTCLSNQLLPRGTGQGSPWVSHDTLLDSDDKRAKVSLAA